MKYTHRLRKELILGTLVLLAGVILLDLRGYFSSLDAKLQDRLLVAEPASSEIVIVAIDDASISSLGVWPWPRSLHAQMINQLTKAGATKVGYDVTFSENSGSATDDTALELALQTNGHVVLASEPSATPLDKLQSAASASGNTLVISDNAGIVRFVPAQDSFAAKVAGEDIPLIENGQYRLPFVGAPGSFKTIPFADILAGQGLDRLTNKIVLIGATAPDLHDTYLTPTSSGQFMSGVEIQTNAIQGIQHGVAIAPLSLVERLGLYALLALFLLGLALLSLRAAVIASIVFVPLYLITALILGSNHLLWPMVFPYVLTLSILALTLVIHFIEERRRRAWIHDAFGHYIAPQVIEKILQGETKLELGGVKKELTILFSDIRGFTTLSETLSPEALVTFLNEYLTAMTDIVLSSEGVVDKYIGDAIMAFWGAPVPQDDHAERSAKAAINMKRRLLELQQTWSKQGKPIINIGVGLNSGEVLLGNMGSNQRFDYTVMGDNVNLASRLESLTKQYGVTILASEATVQKLPRSIPVRLIDLVAVKGKTQPVKIYELDAPAWREEFTAATELYFKKEWVKALPLFQSLANLHHDKPAEIFAERCRHLIATPPEESWNGVYIAKEK